MPALLRRQIPEEPPAKGKARRFTPSAMANLYVSYTDLEVEGKGLTFGLSLGLTLGMRRESVTWMND